MHGMPDQLSDIYKPGRNCWTVGSATHVSILIDYANYYKAVYESMLKAKHSIFILGWDIDSRVKLVRGNDAKDGIESLHDVLTKVAKENPSLQIYLNKWNYSTFFISQREPFWVNHWKKTGLKNIHVCLDGRVPLGGCHHQKVILVDDEIAYWGGMDIALGRWDKRSHHIEEPDREDPSGLPNPGCMHAFGPYHDIQAVASGPIVNSFCHLVRDRWHDSCDIEAVPIRTCDREILPEVWPQSFKPKFENVSMALARNFPQIVDKKPIREVEQLFYDEIARAENFIYIENQYMVVEKFARALNQRLREAPNLRVLAVSCHEPQGMMERKVMWAGRLPFSEILKSGGVEDRVALVYSACKEKGEEKSVHIHSKMMIVDDKYLHLGSSNIAYRSMGMDTELDVSIVGSDPTIRKQIESIRNDLIREHCGREIKDIQKYITDGDPVSIFYEDLKTSTHHFHIIDDEPYRHEKFVKLARFFGDPPKPIVPIMGRIKFHSGISEGGLPRHVFFLGLVLPVLALLVMAWIFTPLPDYLNVEFMTGILKDISSSPLAILYATVLYTISAIFFCPITILTAAMVIVFGPLKGVAIAYVGSILSGLVGYYAGRFVGPDRAKAVFGNLVGKILEKIKENGIISVALLRSMPLGPYQLINVVFGAARVPVLSFVIGTIIGLAPGKLALALTGEGLMQMIENPNPTNILYLILGLIVWGGFIIFTHKIAKRRQLNNADA